MQTYDLLMILVLVGATLFGFWKGMAWQIASLASLVASYFVALKYADQLAPMISDHAPWNKFVAMLAIYIGTSFVIWTAFRLVSNIIDKVKLDGFDHQMGALIGFAKGVLLCTAITFFAVTILPEPQQQMIIASNAGKYIVRFLDKTDAIVPPEVHQVIHPIVERIEAELNPDYQPHAADRQATWPTAGLPVWPSEETAQTPWPSADQPVAPSQPVWPERPDAADSGWPQPEAQPQPVWPSQPNSQTADRPGGAPI